MGLYTPNINLYKVDSNEIVDVEAQLNNNWRLLDDVLRKYLEYSFTSVKSITNSIPDRKNGYRWFKQYTNSVWVQDGNPESGGSVTQDFSARVYNWVSADSLIGSGWSAHPEYPPFYRIIPITGSVNIEWSGSVWRGGSAITLNTTYTNVFNLPANLTPVVSHYFNRAAGNGSSGPSIARVMFNSNAQVEIQRYGYNTSGGVENRIDLGGVRYNVGVTGT